MIERLGLSGGAAMLSARQRVQRRCARFVPQDGFSLPMIVNQRTQAARAGSLAAEAALLAMERPLEDGDDYRRDLVQRVLDSGDPFAFVAIAPAMGSAGGAHLDTLGEVSGSELSEIAWRIASCRLGMDCSPEGSMMTNYCVNGGICSQDASQDFSSFARDAGIPARAKTTWKRWWGPCCPARESKDEIQAHATGEQSAGLEPGGGGLRGGGGHARHRDA